MADCKTRQGSRQHFCRLGVRRTPNRSSMSLAVNVLTSSIVRPSNFSTIIEAAAWLMQQPSPSKKTSRRVPSIIDLQFHADDVAAKRIVVLMGVRAVRAVTAMIRILVMIEDMVLVKFFFVGRHDRPGKETKENPLC